MNKLAVCTLDPPPHLDVRTQHAERASRTSPRRPTKPPSGSLIPTTKQAPWMTGRRHGGFCPHAPLPAEAPDAAQGRLALRRAGHRRAEFSGHFHAVDRPSTGRRTSRLGVLACLDRTLRARICTKLATGVPVSTLHCTSLRTLRGRCASAFLLPASGRVGRCQRVGREPAVPQRRRLVGIVDAS